MKTITFNLLQFENSIDNLGSISDGVYGIDEKGNFYHAFFGNREIIIKGLIKNESE